MHKLSLWGVQRVTLAPCSSRLSGSKAHPGAGRPALHAEGRHVSGRARVPLGSSDPQHRGCERGGPGPPLGPAGRTGKARPHRGRDRTGAAAAWRAEPVEAARAHASQRSDARQAAATSDSTDAASGSGTRRPVAHPRPTFPAPQRIGRGKAKFGSRR